MHSVSLARKSKFLAINEFRFSQVILKAIARTISIKKITQNFSIAMLVLVSLTATSGTAKEQPVAFLKDKHLQTTTNGKPKTVFKTVPVYKLSDNPKAFGLVSQMRLDVDGAAHAYRADDNQKLALDWLANAGTKGHWYGVEMPSDVIPRTTADGYCISTTSLNDPTKQGREKYVDAMTIPYIALSPELQKLSGASLGSVVEVINLANGKSCAAIYADMGNPNEQGEGSIALAKALGATKLDARNDGISENVLYIIFPDSKDTAKSDAKRIPTLKGIGEKEKNRLAGFSELQKWIDFFKTKKE